MTEAPRRGGWLSRDQALALCLIAGTALFAYLCWRLARPFLAPLLWAAVLAVVTHPLHRSIRRRLKRPGLAAGLGVAVVSVAIVAPAVFVGRQLLREASSGVDSLQEEVSRGRWRATIQRNPRLGPLFTWIERQLGGGDAAKTGAAAVAARVRGILTGSRRGLVELGIALLALFYFFRDDEPALKTLRSLSPLPEAETDRILRRVAETVHATLYGILVVSALQGALGGLSLVGAVGVFLGPVVLAIAVELLGVWRRRTSPSE